LQPLQELQILAVAVAVETTLLVKVVRVVLVLSSLDT
jgi:hypothetical protein